MTTSSLGPFDPVPNSSFLKNDPFVQFAWDSTSLGTFKECPWKYFLTNICGYIPKHMAIPLIWGILYHEAHETYDKLIAEGMDKKEALMQTVQCAAWKGLAIPDGRSERTQQTLIRAIVWYVNQFHNDPCETVILKNGKPAVELSFAFEFDKIKGVNILLCGHLDKLVHYDNGIWFKDHKSTTSALDENYFATYAPDNQWSLYSVATQVVLDEPAVGGIVDAIQLQANSCRFKRREVRRSPEQNEEWIADTKHWISWALHCAETKTWPKNEKSCGFYGGCKFRRSCSECPSVAQNFLMADFKRRAWDPMQSR